MWNTEFNDFDMSATPFKRDIIGEMAKACEKAGMKYGIYYSQRDWHHPDYGPESMAKYNQYMRNQIKELLVRHPNITIMWFDSGAFPYEIWEGDSHYRMIHELRPDIVINNRCGLPGDFNSPEQHIGDFDLERDWESCMTFTGFWSWHGYQTKVITFEECLAQLGPLRWRQWQPAHEHRSDADRGNRHARGRPPEAHRRMAQDPR